MRILLILLLFSINAYANDGFSFEPNEHITTGSWVNGKYQTTTTVIDSTGQKATTSGWINGKYETTTTVIDSNGMGATTSGWHDGQYVIKHSTFSK